MMDNFQGKVGLVQRVFPSYRASFFDALGSACTEGLAVFAGQAKPSEMIHPANELQNAQLTIGHNVHLFQGRFYVCLQPGLMNWLKELDPDVLIMEANPRYLSSPSAIRWMHQRNRPVIGWGLGAPSIVGEFLSQVRQQRRARFLHEFDSLISYSQTGAAEYTQMGFPEDQIFVAANAVAPRPTHPLPERRDIQSGEKVRLLFVGRLQERKNIDNLIHACADLPELLQPELVIVGDGPARDSYALLAEQLYPNTTFTGSLYGDPLTEQFINADLFVLPGTGGLATQQAMSYGLPVIVAEADGTQEDLVRPENGWQIPPNDISALRQALSEALSDIKGLRKKGEQSYRIVSEEINLEQMVAAFVNALNRSVR